MTGMQLAGLGVLLTALVALSLGIRLLDLLAPADSTPGSFDRALRGLWSWRPWLGLLLLAGGVGGILTGVLLLIP